MHEFSNFLRGQRPSRWANGRSAGRAMTGLALCAIVVSVVGCAARPAGSATSLSAPTPGPIAPTDGTTPQTKSQQSSPGSAVDSEPPLPANAGCTFGDVSGSEPPPGPKMQIGLQPTKVTATWTAASRTDGCPHIVGDAVIARALATQLNAGGPGFLGTRTCPGDWLSVTLHFEFAGRTASQDVGLTVAGCNGAVGPGPDGKPAYVTVASNVFQTLEPLAPPNLLDIVRNAAKP